MSRSTNMVHAGSEVDLLESLFQPNLVDINDFVKNKSKVENHSGLRPSLKPLKLSKMKKENREENVVSVEAPQKKIIYIKTFNHVKNEPIIMPQENQTTKNLPNLGSDFTYTKPKAVNKKKESGYSFDTQVTLNFFKMNKEKFNPTKQIKKPEEQPNKQLEENSTLKEFEFLTGVNLQGVETYRDEQEEESPDPLENWRRDSDFNQHQYVPKNSESYLPENPTESQNQVTESAKISAKGQTNLPSIKKYYTPEQAVISVSEARYKKPLEQKPKMFISYKTNSVQPYGRPMNYKDHLERVYNKESTPTVSYPLVNTLGPKKDYRKAILETYLAQFNIEALKDIDEGLYEYAKQQQKGNI